MRNGVFGSLFDMNRDGKLDSREQFLDYMLFQECCNQNKKEERKQSRNGFLLSSEKENGKINPW